jgi:hypothetical protein
VELVEICSCFFLIFVVRYGRLYVLICTRFYKGLMLRVDDELKEVQAVEIGACKGIRMQNLG